MAGLTTSFTYFCSYYYFVPVNDWLRTSKKVLQDELDWSCSRPSSRCNGTKQSIEDANAFIKSFTPNGTWILFGVPKGCSQKACIHWIKTRKCAGWSPSSTRTSVTSRLFKTSLVWAEVVDLWADAIEGQHLVKPQKSLKHLALALFNFEMEFLILKLAMVLMFWNFFQCEGMFRLGWTAGHVHPHQVGDAMV